MKTVQYNVPTRRRLQQIALVGLLGLTGFEAPARAANFVTNGQFNATGASGNSPACGTAPCFAATGGGINTGTDYNTGGNLGSWTVVDVGSSQGLAFLYASGAQGSTTANQGITQQGRFGGFALWDPNNTTSGTGGAIPNTSPGGGNFIVADGGSSYNVAIYQTLTGLTPGAIYSLSFWYSAGQQTAQTGPTVDNWQVSFGNSAILTEGGTAAGTTVVDTPTINLASQGFQAWAQDTISFTAHSSSQVLTFLSEGTPDGAPPIDLLSDVMLTSTPEPASMGMFGAGIVSLIALLWFRKNQVRKPAPSSDNN